MANAAIELHDSRVTAIHTEGSAVVLDLDAYVHVSDGRPGVDAGTGWSWPVRMSVRDGAVQRDFEGDALWIADGTVRIGDRMLDKMLPLALDQAGSVAIELTGGEGRMTVTGTGLRIESMGEGTFVEAVPADEE
jgi:hypothetical protein